MVDEPDNLVLELLRRMREDMTAMKADMTAMKADMTAMKSDMTAVKADVHAIKRDVHEIKHIQVSHSLKLDYLEENFEKVIEGTVTAIRTVSNAATLQLRTDRQIADLTQRVERLERAG